MATEPNPPRQNGSSPEPSEATNSDSGFLEQLRQAALAEQDPEMKEKLWQAYQKRKALQDDGS